MMYPKPSRPPRPTRAQAKAAYAYVMERDKGCIARIVDPGADPCAGPLTREHVRPGGGAMGARRITTEEALVIVCAHHHLDGWATAHKSEEREYLRRAME